MGVCLRQRPDRPGWWVIINHRNKRKKKHFPDKETAARFARQIREHLALGEFGIVSDQELRPFGPYYTHWLNSYAKTHTKAATYANYETAYRVYLLPFFGEDLDIRDITREMLKRFIYEALTNGKKRKREGQAQAGLSRSSVKAIIAPLSEMFNHAIEDGHIDRNPCVRIMRSTREEKGQQCKVDFLTREELAVLLDTCREQFPASYPFVLLLARTGLRVGEAVALHWGDLDFHGRFINVHRNWVDGRLTTPKSGKGRRVDMSLHLTETLKALLVERKKETLKKGWGEVPEWVFTNEVGNMMDPDNFRKRVWPKLLEKAGLRHLRIHDLRHTFASLLIQQGESLVYVMEQMGHHSIRVTVDIYGHLVPGGNKAAVDRLDHAISENAVSTGPKRTLSAPTAAAVELKAR
jgi:integrase